MLASLMSKISLRNIIIFLGIVTVIVFFFFPSFTGKETSSKKLSAFSKATWSVSGGDGI